MTVSVYEEIAFWVLGPLSLAGALGMLFSRSAVHSALWLVLTMLSLGVLYMVQDAPFLGIVQIIVYTGAIMMLFLFVLMLAGRESSDSVVEVLRGQRIWASLLGIGLAGLIVAGVARSLGDVTPAGLDNPAANGSGGPGNVANIGQSIFTRYLFPFELTSALLITAAIGAMVLAHTRKQAKGGKNRQREMVNMRFRENTRPGALPGPGVFATADSVATPALLPDGSIAKESLSRIIETTPVTQIEEDEALADRHPDAHALTGAADKQKGEQG
ncbi:NADH-quinone oxidoreductase subunit J [Sciscionella sediminilitoris]|uniref:NADH-quinone oxidoreductase subunit J n=1 Tax=Sciscionella sediminilitoris TaxID=1445613 RepID=UPI00068E461D|nr:NADH-quinone oxidoreductase subunit J [Sciscionella sp. SE31]